MKFSIITICYNPGEAILAAVDSVKNQDYENIEHVIVDGGSTDGTLKLLQGMELAQVKFISEPDDGLYDALNKGVRLASGDCIGFVHADDLLSSNDAISKIAARFKESGIDGVYGDLQYTSKADTDKIIRNWVSGEYDICKLKNGWMPPHPALYLKREVYEIAKLDSGEYFDTSMKIAADYDFMMRVLSTLQIKVGYLPEVLVKMRVGGESNKSIRNIIQKSKEDYTAMKRNGIGGLRTLVCKNLRKITQFLQK